MNPFIRPGRCESAACVEVSIGDEVTVRSSRDPDRTVVFTREEWEAFTAPIEHTGWAKAIAALPAGVRIVEAARLLVKLKDGPRDDLYEVLKPDAWQEAREALAEYDGRPDVTA
jgi:hypothetical protein